MSLTLVTGRANSGKTGLMHEAVRSAARARRGPSLLLPTYPDVVRATAEFALTDPVGVRVSTLDDWIGERWRLYGDGRRIVHPAQRGILLREALRSTPLRSLAASAATPGFLTILARVAGSVSETSSAVLDGVTGHSEWDAELLEIVAAYEAELDGHGLIESGAAALAMAENMHPVDGPLMVHRFADLSRSQEGLMVSAASVGDVWISLPWEEGFPATQALDGLVSRLSRHGEMQACPPQPAGHPELDRLEAGLFRAPRVRPPEGAVVFCTAGGPEAEAALIAEQATRLISESGSGERIAIVFRDAARHVSRLTVAFRGAGVPADFDVLVPVMRTPFGVALAALVSFTTGAGVREPILRFLRSPFSGADPADVDRLDAAWRREGIMDSARIARDVSRPGPGPGRALKLARTVCAEGGGRAEAGDWKKLADALLRSAHDHVSLQADQEADIDVAAHRSLMETVIRIAEIDGGRCDALDVMAALGQARTAPATVERPGHVQVTEAHRLRGRRFDAVIVGGLTAGEFSAEGRTSVSGQIVARLTGDRRPAEQALERLLFYNVVTRARHHLVLTRQSSDPEGSPIRPSVFWEEALDLFRSPDADPSADVGVVVSGSVGLTDLERAAPALTPGRARLRKAAAGRSRVDGADERVVAALRRTAERRGEIRDPEALAWLASRNVFSATELETYAGCPYRWFYQSAVAPDSLEVTLDAANMGDLTHRVLKGLYTELPVRLGIRRVTEGVLGEALSLAEEIFSREALSGRTPQPMTLVEEDDLTRALRWVKDLVTADCAFLPTFTPAHVEFKFGVEGQGSDDASSEADEPVDLGGFALRGSIDRIDVSEEGLAVIDYKTGRVPKLADFTKKRVLQVPLYAAVARERLGRPVLLGLYRGLKSGEARGFYLRSAAEPGSLKGTDALDEQAQVDAVIQAAVDTAREAAQGIRAGRIRPLDPAVGACDFCPAQGICPREE